jgi:hypothetical protein
MTKNILRLVVTGLILTTASLLRAAIAPAENLLPADTIAFFTVPDCTALRAASTVSPQLMFWNDPAMRPIHDKFMGKLTEKFVTPLENDLGLKVADFTSLLQGQFTFAVTVNGSTGHDDVPPGLLVLLDARDKSPQLQTNLAALTKKMTDAGRALRTENIRGIPFTVVTLSSNDLANVFGQGTPVSEIGKEPKPQKPVDIYFAQYQSLLIAANSAALAGAVIAHLTGGSVPALADDPAFAADKLSQFRNPPTYYGWFNGKVFFNLLNAGSVVNGGDADADPMMSNFSAAKILGATGLGNLRSASFALHEAREGSTADLHITAPVDERNGILKLLSLPARDSSPPAFVPADAIKFTRVRLDGSQTWTGLQKMFADLSPQALAGINSVVDLANASVKDKDPSFDLRKNLFANLGDDFISYSKAPLGDSLTAMAHPPSIFLIGTPNPDQMIEAIKVVGSLMAPQDSSVQPRDFHGHKIHSLAMRAQRTAAGSIPQPPLLLSSASGYLAITTDAGILEEFLRSADANLKPLRETAGLNEAAAHVGGTSTGLFSYQNQREVMRESFRLFKSAVDNDPTMKMFPPAFRDWADFSLLPEYDAVSKYFYMTVFTGSADAGGLSLKIFTPRPPQLN